MQGLVTDLHATGFYTPVPILLSGVIHPLPPKPNIRNSSACFHVLGLVYFSMGYFYSCPDPSHTGDLMFQPKQ